MQNTVHANTHVVAHGEIAPTVHALRGMVTVEIHPADQPGPMDPSVTVTTPEQADALAEAFNQAAVALRQQTAQNVT